MLNYWWVTRPKRKLNSIPEVLACCAKVSLNSEWQGNRFTHLTFEQALEDSGLKRKGERRDQRGGGGRTYFAWLFSLGLVFTHEATGQVKLTLAGEAVLESDSPVNVIINQVLKYQFPSPFSLSPASSKVRLNHRFHIRPFRFLLRLLSDAKLSYYLTQDEIAKVVITEAENENDSSYYSIVDRILQYRANGMKALSEDFFNEYAPSSGTINPEHPYSHLCDVANTLINWLEYTQFIARSINDFGIHQISILPDKMDEVDSLLSDGSLLVDRPNEQEYFQRKYGLDPKHQRDNRNILATQTITARIINEQQIKQAFITESIHTPVTAISAALINKIAEKTNLAKILVEETLMKLYPKGAINAFMTEYFEMAFKGKDEAAEFEKTTAEIFEKVFGFKSYHVGPKGLSPDVLIVSENYQAIFDNKAYSNYTISNDHQNRMVHNYIEHLNNYSSSQLPLAFFVYISGEFGGNIEFQIKSIVNQTNIHGSAISVSNLIKMIEINQTCPYTHDKIREIFSVDRKVLLSDL